MSENTLQHLDPLNVKAKFGITDQELEAVKLTGVKAITYLDTFINDMYLWMPSLREFKTFFSVQTIIPQVQAQQKIYWQVFFFKRRSGIPAGT